MTKHFLFALSFLAVVFTASAQVTNYSLKLNGASSADFGNYTEINNLSAFTVQFWINPSTWNAGSAVFSRDENSNSFSARLGAATNEIVFQIGSQNISITSSSIGVNKWSQITFICDNGGIKVLVNNVQVKQQTIMGLTIPNSASAFILGTSFVGRIDEFRLWNIALTDPNFRLWRNTVNKFHPNWDKLLVYYKFDQNLCLENIVDYKFNHHGAFLAGAQREAVTDNALFKYRINSAYTDFGRWADRMVDRDKYLMANDIIMLGVQTFSDGRVDIPIPNNHGTLTNAVQLDNYQGRNGVLSLNGVGAQMNVGPRAIDNTSVYTFHTWFYLDEWVEGAFLYKKEASDTQGFSIRFGSEASKQLIVRLNGVEFKRAFLAKDVVVGNWFHIAIVTNPNAVDVSDFFGFVYNGGSAKSAQVYPATKPSSYLFNGVQNTDALIGLNLKGKLDETVIWSNAISSTSVAAYMTKLPMPSYTSAVDPASVLFYMNSFWNYDIPSDPGYDSYSYTHFMNLVKENFKGYRGYKIRLSVSGHDGWATTIANTTLRKKLAQGIVKYASEYDGIDLDLEWCYDGSCWGNYGLLADEIAKTLPADKIFTVSPHGFSFGFPVSSMASVDYFTFQIYGPQSNWFAWSAYQKAYNDFIAWGYPKEKIIMSYAAITSNSNDGAPPIGVRPQGNSPYGLLDGSYTPDMDVVLDSNGKTRYITGVNQTRNRAELIQDNDAAGIFYWDMGNDVVTTHKYSLARTSTYAIASNVDTLITSVKTTGLKSVISNDNAKALVVYPNPAISKVNFLLPDANVEAIDYQLYNAMGQIVATKRSVPTTERVDLSNLSEGVYILKVVTTKGQNYLQSFVKSH